MRYGPITYRPPARGRPRAAFTLVELLVVIAIIILLIGILSTAVIKARRVGEVGATERVLGALLVGAQGFSQDHDRFPRSDGTDPISSASGEGGQMLAQSLLGYEDGDGKDGMGFRVQGRPTGKVYGPYVSADQYAFGGTEDHGDVFLDAWEQPIAYWRNHGPRDDVWGNSGRFVPDENQDLLEGDPKLNSHPDVDHNSLRTADIVLYSKGPNGSLNDDDEGEDRRSDDVVFVGP